MITVRSVSSLGKSAVACITRMPWPGVAVEATDSASVLLIASHVSVPSALTPLFVCHGDMSAQAPTDSDEMND